MLAATVPWLMVSGILSAASPATATSPTSSSLGTSEPLTLDGDVPWIVPPELSRPSEAESDALADTAQTLALRDVELDWYKVLGYRAVIYANSSFGPRSPLAKALPPAKKVAVFFGDADRHPYLEVAFNLSARGCGLERGAEAHCLLRIDNVPWGGEVLDSAVVAVGNGTRGAVYAAYALSEELLGVAPFYRFTFDQPLWSGASLPIQPGLATAYAPPAFTHRTIFLNDEELLGFFRRDPLGEQIFDPATCDMILEALLRAKGNAIIFGTTPYPDERSLKLAARRGVVSRLPWGPGCTGASRRAAAAVLHAELPPPRCRRCRRRRCRRRRTP
jgi:hypothetical protein